MFSINDDDDDDDDDDIDFISTKKGYVDPFACAGRK